MSFFKVNVLEELARKFDRQLTTRTCRVRKMTSTAVSTHRSMARARVPFERLRDADTDAARAQVTAEMEAYSTTSAAALGQAFSYQPGTDGSFRDAYCKADRAYDQNGTKLRG